MAIQVLGSQLKAFCQSSLWRAKTWYEGVEAVWGSERVEGSAFEYLPDHAVLWVQGGQIFHDGTQVGCFEEALRAFVSEEGVRDCHLRVPAGNLAHFAKAALKVGGTLAPVGLLAQPDVPPAASRAAPIKAAPNTAVPNKVAVGQ